MLIGITTLLLIVGMFSVWANRLVFNPDNWSNTSTQLLQNPAIRTATANYLVDQLYANVDVEGLIKQGLPKQSQGLAGLAGGGLRDGLVHARSWLFRTRMSRTCGPRPTARQIRRSSMSSMVGTRWSGPTTAP